MLFGYLRYAMTVLLNHQAPNGDVQFQRGLQDHICARGVYTGGRHCKNIGSGKSDIGCCREPQCCFRGSASHTL